MSDEKFRPDEPDDKEFEAGHPELRKLGRETVILAWHDDPQTKVKLLYSMNLAPHI